METTTEERRNGEETFKYEVVKSLMEHAKMPRMEWGAEWGKEMRLMV